MPERRHLISVFGGTGNCQARCVCGWRGEWVPYITTAEAQGQWHRSRVNKQRLAESHRAEEQRREQEASDLDG